MKKVGFWLLLFIAIPCHLFASFENNDWGVRALGMGGAFTALADDGSAQFWNPGATGFLKKAESSFMWQRVYPGLTDLNIASGYLSLLMPTRNGSFGAGLTSYNFGSLLRENTALFHYGRKFGQKLGLGFNLKYLTHDYLIGADPALSSSPLFANGTSQGAFSFDLGMSLRPTQKILLGFAGRNISRPDVGIASEDRIAAEYQAGIAVKPMENLTVEMDLAHLNSGSGNFSSNSRLLMGMEHWFWSQDRFKAAARFGLNRELDASQSLAVKNLAGGLSLLAGKMSGFAVRLDYSFAFNLGLANAFDAQRSATHKVGFSLLFETLGAKPSGASALAVPQMKGSRLQNQKAFTERVQKKTKKSSLYYLSVIALKPINLSKNEAWRITNLIKQEFSRSGKFNLLDDSQIEEIIKKRFSGELDKNAANIGILTGNIHKHLGKYFIEVQYIPVGTDKLTLSDSLVVLPNQKLTDAAGELAGRMIREITK